MSDDTGSFPPDPDRRPADAAASPRQRYKSVGGLRRVRNATSYSIAGLRAAWRHEAAFRQEVALGVPLLALVPWVAAGRWQALVLVGSVLLVWVVEMLNSAIEALADAVSLSEHPLLGRAKDLGSAAVMLSLLQLVVAWTLVLWP